MKNPAFSTLLLEEKFTKVLKTFKELYGIEYHFLRCEIQARGSLHLHALLRITDAPDYELLTKSLSSQYLTRKSRKSRSIHTFPSFNELMKVISSRVLLKKSLIFYSSKVSESMPDPFSEIGSDFDKEIPFLHYDFSPARVNLLCHSTLMHKCTENYCLNGRARCRFGFGKRLTSHASVSIFDRTKSAKPGFKISFPRNSCYLGSFSPTALAVLGANTDLQVIMDPGTLLAYVLKYVIKSEPHSNVYRKVLQLDTESSTNPNIPVYIH